MEKKVLLKELVDSGTNIRRNFIPKAVVSTDGEYQIGEFWDANKTIDVIVNNSHKQHDNIRELDEYTHAEEARAKAEEHRLDEVKVGRSTAADIKMLTNNEINALHTGDTIIKSSNGKEHAYTVTYKKDNEMSIVYADHETVEEVYYEKSGDNWAYIQTDTFKPEDYYTKTQVDTLVNNKFDDVLGVDAQGISSLKAIVEDLDTTTGILDTINGKQETLVSGTNIKTVSGQSVLGSGDIVIDYTNLSNKPTIPTVPTNVSAFNNDAGYLTSHQDLTSIISRIEALEAAAGINQ